MSKALDDYYMMIERIGRLYKYTMILQGVIAGLWIIILGVIDLFVNSNTYWITIAIFFGLYVGIVVHVLSTRSKSRGINFYRLTMIISLIISNNYFSQFLLVTIMIFTVVFLFQQALEILTVRIDRSSLFSSTYNFDNTNNDILSYNMRYISDRLSWIFSTHLMLVIIVIVMLILVEVFSLLQSINNEFTQYFTFFTIFLLMVLIILKMYLPEIKNIDNIETTN